MDLPRRSLRAPLSSFARVAARSRPARCNATQNGEHLESAAERAAAGCAGVLRGANLTVRGALRSWRLCETAEAVPSSWPPDPASWGGAHQRVRPTLRAGTHRDQSWCSCDAICSLCFPLQRNHTCAQLHRAQTASWPWHPSRVRFCCAPMHRPLCQPRKVCVGMINSPMIGCIGWLVVATT